MAEDINDTIHVIVDHRVGICPFNVNKWDVTDTFPPHGAAEVSFNLRNALNDCSVEQNVGSISKDMYHFRKHQKHIKEIILVHRLQHFWNSHVA